MELERSLQNFDYSLLSGVRDKLLENLLIAQRNKRNARRLFASNMLTDEELDLAAAAGTPYQKCGVKAPCFSYGDETPQKNSCQ